MYSDADNRSTRRSALRQVLGDDSQEPRFVQTVTGMGYRFIAPVEEINPPGAVPSASSVFREQGVSAPQVPNLAASEPRRQVQLWRVPILAVGLAAAMPLASLLAILRRDRLTDKTAILSMRRHRSDASRSEWLESRPMARRASLRRLVNNTETDGPCRRDLNVRNSHAEVRTGRALCVGGSIAGLVTRRIGLGVNCDTETFSPRIEQAADWRRC